MAPSKADPFICCRTSASRFSTSASPCKPPGNSALLYFYWFDLGSGWSPSATCARCRRCPRWPSRPRTRATRWFASSCTTWTRPLSASSPSSLSSPRSTSRSVPLLQELNFLNQKNWIFSLLRQWIKFNDHCCHLLLRWFSVVPVERDLAVLPVPDAAPHVRQGHDQRAGSGRRGRTGPRLRHPPCGGRRGFFVERPRSGPRHHGHAEPARVLQDRQGSAAGGAGQARNTPTPLQLHPQSEPGGQVKTAARTARYSCCCNNSLIRFWLVRWLFPNWDCFLNPNI